MAYVESKPSPRSATKSIQIAPSESGLSDQTSSVSSPGMNFLARLTSSSLGTVSRAATTKRRSAYCPNRSDTITRHNNLASRLGRNHGVILDISPRHLAKQAE